MAITNAFDAKISKNGSAVIIGKFDGVHLGHQKLIADLLEVSRAHSLDSVVLTFDRHPDALLSPESCPLPLIGPEQKEQLIASFGVDILLTLTFDESLASLSPEDFVQKYLVDSLAAKVVIVGDDFRFGARGAGDVGTLHDLGQELGFEVRVVSAATVSGIKISTSEIRNLLDKGDVQLAAAMLGRHHESIGEIEHGLKIGRSIGFPTANMARDCAGYLPLDGVYAGWLHVEDQKYPAAHSVGINATFQAVPRLVESHILDRDDIDLYDKTVRLEYVAFIRPAEKFNGVDDLVVAINRDLEKTRQILGT